MHLGEKQNKQQKTHKKQLKQLSTNYTARRANYCMQAFAVAHAYAGQRLSMNLATCGLLLRALKYRGVGCGCSWRSSKHASSRVLALCGRTGVSATVPMSSSASDIGMETPGAGTGVGSSSIDHGTGVAAGAGAGAGAGADADAGAGAGAGSGAGTTCAGPAVFPPERFNLRRGAPGKDINLRLTAPVLKAAVTELMGDSLALERFMQYGEEAGDSGARNAIAGLLCRQLGVPVRAEEVRVRELCSGRAGVCSCVFLFGG